MSNFILLAVCFLTGIILRRTRRVPENGSAAMNAVIVHLSLPAVALSYVHSLPLSLELLWPALMPWILFGAGCLIFFLVGRKFRLSRARIGCLCLCAGLGNTSFVGLPMIEAFYGDEWLGLGLVCDQAGSFMVLSTLGLTTAAICSGRSLSRSELARRIFLFPPFLAVLLALALKPVPYPGWFEQLLERIGGTLSPLALLTVGMAVRFNALKGRLKPLMLGLGYKMVLGPLLILVLYHFALGQSGPAFQVTVFEAAMAPMITGGIIAMQYDLEPDLAMLLIGAGVPLSFLTLPLWSLLLGLF